MDLKEFCKSLPKLELHAHLNGSLSETTLKKLGCLNAGVDEYRKLKYSNILDKTNRTLNECFELFKVAHKVTNKTEAVYLATTSVIQEFYEDNVIYLELRTTPRLEIGMTKKEYVHTVIKAIKDNKNDIIVKLLLCIDRRHSNIINEEDLSLIIEMKETYPDIVKGIDLCGNPNEGCFDRIIFEKAKQSGLLVTLHCAEIENNEETIEMLHFKPDRIGHATCLHPKYGGSKDIWNLYLTRKIPIEACLTSNVICGTSNNYNEHHIKEWIQNYLPFTLGTDDKGVFCTTLSEEYYLAAENFRLTKLDLWNISRNSVDYAFTSKEDKKILINKLDEWFEKNIVNN